MSRINLAERRAARLAAAEATGEPIEVDIDGEEFLVAREIDARTIARLTALMDDPLTGMWPVFCQLLGDGADQRLEGKQISVQDVVDLIGAIFAEMGLDLGESSASPASSTSTTAS